MKRFRRGTLVAVYPFGYDGRQYGRVFGIRGDVVGVKLSDGKRFYATSAEVERLPRR